MGQSLWSYKLDFFKLWKMKKKQHLRRYICRIPIYLLQFLYLVHFFANSNGDNWFLLFHSVFTHVKPSEGRFYIYQQIFFFVLISYYDIWTRHDTLKLFFLLVRIRILKSVPNVTALNFKLVELNASFSFVFLSTYPYYVSVWETVAE